MAPSSLYSQFETNLMSNRKVVELLLQLKSAKAHGKNHIKVRPLLVRHLLRNRLFTYNMPHLQTFKKSMNFPDCIGLHGQLEKMKFYSIIWATNVRKCLCSQYSLYNLNIEISPFFTTGGCCDNEKSLIFESSPKWQVVRKFSFCRSEGYIVHYLTFG